MRVIWIGLIAFTFAFLAPGNSVPSRDPKAATISSGLPLDSVKHRPEGATDDFTGTGSYAYDKSSSNTLNGIANRKESGEPEDQDPESEEDKLPGSGSAWDSGETEDGKPATKTHELTRSGTDWETKDAALSPQKLLQVVQMLASPGSHPSGSPMPHKNDGDLNVNAKLDPLHNHGVHTKKRKKKKSKKESGGAFVRVLIALFFFGSLLVLLMMAACFAFAWPVRVYYEKLSIGKQVNKRDVESGRRDGNNLQISVRGARNQPPVSQPQPYYSPSRRQRTSECYQNSVYSTVPSGTHQFVAENNADQWAYSYGVLQAYQTPSVCDNSEKKTRDEVIFDDRKRDFRNVERRKIIKQQTSQRRASLADSIAIAKLIIEGYSKNKDFEKKASERRRVIKHCTSPRRSLSTGEKQRSMSFFQELQAGCSVILPSADHQKSVERSKARRRTIKDHSAGKRRWSLADEIGDAKKVIVDSGRTYEKLPAKVVVEETTVAKRPRSEETYSYNDILNLLPQFKDKRSLPGTSKARKASRSGDVGRSTRSASASHRGVQGNRERKPFPR